MKSSHDMSQKELKEEEGKNTELQNMVKALANSIHSMCEASAEANLLIKISNALPAICPARQNAKTASNFDYGTLI